MSLRSEFLRAECWPTFAGDADAVYSGFLEERENPDIRGRDRHCFAFEIKENRMTFYPAMRQQTCAASLWNCDQSRLKRYYDKSTLQKEGFFFSFFLHLQSIKYTWDIVYFILCTLYPLYYCLDPVTQYLYNKKYVLHNILSDGG